MLLYNQHLIQIIRHTAVVELMVSKIEFDKEPTQIVIYFANEVIFSETVKNETLLNRVYKLDSEKKGSYNVVVYNQDRKYSNAFKI